MAGAPSAAGIKAPSSRKAESKGMTDADLADMLAQLKE